ncbi:OLC1v1036269C1 [Oldenlandia corymbosa var. corymbosa]|uniref:OLC1v1036269C1 n=1 Tax=Oldenlandia corymbosa var. corymbosa TaxID=529605 RepID=A0AAV1CW10_OLDCO|nr:OLC1v1036269C1 [Oldenlandia corymbosa var. corymbosa]
MMYLPHFLEYKDVARQPLHTLFPMATDDALDLLSKMFTYDPETRISAQQALQHRYFSSGPLSMEPDSLPRLAQEKDASNPQDGPAILSTGWSTELNPQDGPNHLAPPRKSRRVMPNPEFLLSANMGEMKSKEPKDAIAKKMRCPELVEADIEFIEMDQYWNETNDEKVMNTSAAPVINTSKAPPLCKEKVIFTTSSPFEEAKPFDENAPYCEYHDVFGHDFDHCPQALLKCDFCNRGCHSRSQCPELRVAEDNLEAEPTVNMQDVIKEISGYFDRPQQKVIQYVFNEGDSLECLAEIYMETVTRASLVTLTPEGWLNSEEELKSDVRDGKVLKKIWKKYLTQDTYSGDIHSCEKMFIPINDGGRHWYGRMINFEERRVSMLDSMASSCDQRKALVVKMVKVLQDVLEIGFGNTYKGNIVSFPIEVPNWLPKQRNWYDCGMYVIKFMELYFIMDEGVSFSLNSELDRMDLLVKIIFHDQNDCRKRLFQNLGIQEVHVLQ